MLSFFCTKVGRCGGAAIFAMLKFQLLALQIPRLFDFIPSIYIPLVSNLLFEHHNLILSKFEVHNISVSFLVCCRSSLGLVTGCV